jgi:hypothetical protein
LQNYLRLTARVAVSVSLLGTLVLLSALYFLLRSQAEENYLQAIQSLTRSQDQLVIAMLIGGALIVLLAGLITWFITLYSSARVAGPLYRFSRNIELEIEHGPVETIRIRKGDSFQELSNKLARAAEGLTKYYDGQIQVIDEISRSINSEQRIGASQYGKLLQKLKSTITSTPSL